MPRSYLITREHIPARARFPVIDAHNHLWAAWETADAVVRVMDEVGVAAYADLTANVSLKWADGGYAFSEGRIDDFFNGPARRHPGRFYGFTTATFTRPTDQPLFTDHDRFVEETIAILRDHVHKGARGLKILKELGLRYRDGAGDRVFADDERLAPVWDEVARLGIPVLIHQADPYGFFEPVTPENEHYESMLKYPSWSFVDPVFPRFDELQRRCRNLVRNHPRTTFILPHVANYPENLVYVAQLLDEHSNVYIDVSARLDELGRQPYSAREFIVKYQDRILFGTDMPATVEMYRFYFRFFETMDENFIPPDYDGTFGRYRWRICGIGLPDDVLKKIYHGNALRLIPGLRRDVGSTGCRWNNTGLR